MGESADGNGSRSDGRARLVLLIPLVLVGWAMLRSAMAGPHQHPRVIAQAYEWPEGCSPPRDRRVAIGTLMERTVTEIARACLVKRYFVQNAAELRLLQVRAVGHGGRNYYRIGDSAYNVFCDDDECYESGVVRNMYVRPKAAR